MVHFFVYSVVPIVIIGLIRKYREYVWGKCTIKQSLKNKVFIVTGSNSGIGKETVKELVKKDATVILACRDMEAAATTSREIRKITSSGKMVLLELDLASFTSIRQFVNNVSENCPKIDVLINNAGVSIPLNKKKRTVQDFEIHFGVNHLGHFLLTYLLLNKSRFSPNSRIVIVSSLLAERGEINFNNLNGEQGLKQPRKFTNIAYNNSKLANLYFAKELAQRTKDKEIDVFALCPGFTYTNIFRHYSFKLHEFIFFAPIALFFMRTQNQGAQTVLYCATQPELIGRTGTFYRNCKEFTPNINFKNEISIQLWNVSEELCNRHDALK